MTPAQARFARKLYLFTTCLSVLALITLGIAEGYVRWRLNQNFTFLGDLGFPALSLLVLGELWGLAYLIRGVE
ncbi:MAG TPA: hypothetical protein VMH91_01045 [Candidatus Paceibacterota bacterium]|nr:hypothetical protein [Candidatus Paceibacterota bacterium]